MKLVLRGKDRPTLHVNCLSGSGISGTVYVEKFIEEVFSTSHEIIEEMKPIRCIEHTGTTKHITAFAESNVTSAKLLALPSLLVVMSAMRTEMLKRKGNAVGRGSLASRVNRASCKKVDYCKKS